jgi:hypothetical protein
VRLPGGRSLALLGALGASGCGAERGSLVESACAEVAISQDSVVANSTNALSALVSAHVYLADSVIVRFGVGALLDSATPAVRASSESAVVAVLGLLPAAKYRLRVEAFSNCSRAVGEMLSFETGPLPADLPAYTASGRGASPGYVVFAAGNYGLAIDNTGRVVWYRRFPNGPGLNFQPQPNGRFAARPPVPAGVAGLWAEIAPDGSVTRALGCADGLQPRMHDVILQPDGSYWLLCDEIRTVDLSAQGKSSQAHVLGSGVQWRSAAGDLLFQWSPFDHLAIDLSVLDPPDLAGPIINWTHANALDLDSDGNVIVSFRNLSEVTKIDTRTGALMWRMGGLANEFAFENTSMPAFVHQHGVRVDGAGRLTLLDNLGEQSGSRVERYAYDVPFHTASLSDFQSSAARLVAQVGGSAQRLSDGHTLVSFGNADAVEEHDATGTLVWRLGGDPGYVFRAIRIRSLYQPGVGDPR